MPKFKREARYIVVKLSDMEKSGISLREKESFNTVCDRVSLARVAMGKPPLQCVVVESDWPEYEMTWDAIKARMTGKPSKTDALLEACKAAYLKHHMADDSIGWAELGNILHSALCNTLGDDGYERWIDSLGDRQSA